MRIFRQIFCLRNLISSMALLNEIQAEIETRTLSSGGWATGTGRRAGIETTCYALMALRDRQGPIHDKALEFLLRSQNSNGSWPAFDGDDAQGCWTTALSIIALRFVRGLSPPVEHSLNWLLDSAGREGHWFWKWKFRTVDRAVRINPNKYGWPWFPGTVSWIIPTAFSLLALRQCFPGQRQGQITRRIELGTQMLRDRACPEGGWNAGNGIVFGAALTPHIDCTAITLLGMSDRTDPITIQGLNWIQTAWVDCPSAYSIAWAAIAFSIHEDPVLDGCLAELNKRLSRVHEISDIETLSLTAVAIQAAEGPNPFRVVI
jgi:hypothetical protein